MDSPNNQLGSLGEPTAVAVVHSSTPPLEPMFEVLLMLLHPSKHIHTLNRKTKNTKVEPESKGPYDIPIKMGWNGFLTFISQKLSVERMDLIISSLEWHWVKPSSGPWIPVQDELGYVLMVKKLKVKSEPYIMICMWSPVKKRAGTAWDVSDEPDSDVEDNLHLALKKAKLDDALKEIVAKLTDKYSLGLCPLHPNLPCFHHRPTDLHFNLDRPHVLVWAQAIKAGSATYNKVPLQSPMFKAALAIKRALKFELHFSMAAAAVPPSPSMSAQGLMPTVPPFTNVSLPHYPQIFPQTYRQMLLHPFMSYGAGMSHPFFAAGPGISMPMAASLRSPPSSPPTDVNCSITEFCETYNLGNHAEAGLEKLGFRFGDDLTTVTLEEITEAGFKPLEWKRVLKVYNRLKLKLDSHDLLLHI